MSQGEADSASGVLLAGSKLISQFLQRAQNSESYENEAPENILSATPSFQQRTVVSSTLGTTTYDALRVIGHGAFGCVFLAKVEETEELVAIKRVFQDMRFKNRELHIMRILSQNNHPHPFIITLKNHFFSGRGGSAGSHSNEAFTISSDSARSLSKDSMAGDETEEAEKNIVSFDATNGNSTYLNLVMEYMPETMYNLIKQYARTKRTMPIEETRIYMYQLARALAHIHALGICHRDVKPQNLLINPLTFTLKLCDFGSSKVLAKGEPNVAYVCSRYYRAPELIFGCNDYSQSVDIWSFACVLAELLLGAPMFTGNSGVDHLVEIIKVLGSPSKNDLRSLNPAYQEFQFPNIRAHDLSSIFAENVDANAIEVVSGALKYVPAHRCSAIEIITQPFFLPQLSLPTYVLPPGCSTRSGQPLPATFFKFTEEEMLAAAAKGMDCVQALEHFGMAAELRARHDVQSAS